MSESLAIFYRRPRGIWQQIPRPDMWLKVDLHDYQRSILIALFRSLGEPAGWLMVVREVSHNAQTSAEGSALAAAGCRA